jgi:hypothetical protein
MELREMQVGVVQQPFLPGLIMLNHETEPRSETPPAHEEVYVSGPLI